MKRISTWLPLIITNYTGSRSLSLSKAKAGSASRFGFDRLSHRYTHFLANTCTVTIIIAILLLATSTQATMAQTEPEVTPEGGYPPPATPVQLEEAYPAEPLPPTAPAPEAGYIAPTNAPSQPTNNTVTVIGEGDGAETAASASSGQAVLPISQSRLVRNRAILWAGFLITLLIFFTAVYGAILMYRRRR